MKIIVTGGAGFIGSALCRYLVEEARCSVLNIDKLTYAASLCSLAPIADNRLYRFVRTDICDLKALNSAFQAFEPDAVMHLAAETHVDRSITDSDDFIRSNVQGTHSLIEAARRYWESLRGPIKDGFRFLHVSTDEVYGSLESPDLFCETTLYDPRSPYSASKAGSDHLVSAWHRTYGLPVLITHCSNNYGPYQFPEKLIPLAITNALEGSPLPIYGNGSNVRDWIYVEDHVRALHAVLIRGRLGEKYNIGSRNECSNQAIMLQLCGILDDLFPEHRPHQRLITFVADRPGHDQRYAIDPTKVEKETGWHPRESLRGGLRKTVEWYVANRDWWLPLRENVYRGERLGLLKSGVSPERAGSPASITSDQLL